jgi:hypothetical protein
LRNGDKILSNDIKYRLGVHLEVFLSCGRERKKTHMNYNTGLEGIPYLCEKGPSLPH